MLEFFEKECRMKKKCERKPNKIRIRFEMFFKKSKPFAKIKKSAQAQAPT